MTNALQLFVRGYVSVTDFARSPSRLWLRDFLRLVRGLPVASVDSYWSAGLLSRDVTGGTERSGRFFRLTVMPCSRSTGKDGIRADSIYENVVSVAYEHTCHAAYSGRGGGSIICYVEAKVSKTQEVHGRTHEDWFPIVRTFLSVSYWRCRCC